LTHFQDETFHVKSPIEATFDTCETLQVDKIVLVLVSGLLCNKQCICFSYNRLWIFELDWIDSG